MYAYICISICVSVCVYVCMYMWIYIYICIYIYIYMYMYMCMVTCKFILLLIWKFLKKNKNLEIKKKKKLNNTPDIFLTDKDFENPPNIKLRKRYAESYTA